MRGTFIKLLNKAPIWLLFLTFLQGIYPQAVPQNEKLAYRHLSEAEILYREGRQEEAESRLNRALELFPDFSEAHYLLYRMYSSSQETTLRSLDYLQRAIAEDTWTKTDPSEAILGLGRLLLRIGRTEDANKILVGIASQRINEPEPLMLLARSYMQLGDLEQSLKVLDRGVMRFGQNIEMNVLFAQSLLSSNRFSESIRFIERLLEQDPENTQLLIFQILHDNDSPRKADAVSRYISAGGKDPLVLLNALKIGGSGTSDQSLITLFFEGGGGDRVDLLEQLQSFIGTGNDLSGIVMQKVAGFSGDRIIDKNRDGFYEEKYTYRDGRLIKLIRDSNQDGRPEMVFYFDEAGPRRLVKYNEGEQHLEYGPYPFIEKIAFVSEGEYREYLLRQFQIEGLKIEKSPIALKETLVYQLYPDDLKDSSTESQISQVAFRIRVFNPDDEIPFRTIELDKGHILLIQEDRNRDGNMEYRLKFYGDLPVYGWRDLNENGIFDTKEQWIDGSCAEIIHDFNEDGIYEIFRIFDDRGQWMMWDYNKDGIIDSKIYSEDSALFTWETGIPEEIYRGLSRQLDQLNAIKGN